MGKRAAIVWFRRDLRLHDNEALTDAMKHGDEVLPVYIFDPREWRGTLPLTGLPKIGPHRARFILESVADLRDNLRRRGGDLIIRTGHPEDILPELSKQCQGSWVFCNRERTSEELRVQNAVEQNLWAIGREVYYSRGKLLYYTSDLPFPITQTPDGFTQFRKETERLTPVRDPLPAPGSLPMVEGAGIDPGELPQLADFGVLPPPADERSAIDWHGGETSGFDRLAYYLFDSHAIATYKETRNGLIGGDYSTKFSAWLAQGCLSPKRIYAEVRAYEAKNGANDSTYWVIYELLWRDFFRLMGKKHGDRIFQKYGFSESTDHPDWKKNPDLLQRWIDGQTGTPFIDANMREIARTGFMSNRGRQNVASYLVKDLELDWRLGAEYFEHMLIDYDVTSNWCNWNYVAGVGSDPRDNRYFNILNQAERYDPEGAYVKLWCPELRELPVEYVHQPDTLDEADRSAHGLRLGANYPTPLVPSKRWKDQSAPSGRRRGRGRASRSAV
ncbi:DASH family cryptochrome [Lewinella sp. JB7]|uniref:DASH family cryptochrome n=1 Tax=Lewinella sp. JB7 TaxID=2962887 RepID=UPI0020C996C9|nr:DASH family cryptochrome [Lewinella sp. JB7]MCP9236489.1 DASH family cryptochrome [Lewinella sp. JB7]